MGKRKRPPSERPERRGFHPQHGGLPPQFPGSAGAFLAQISPRGEDVTLDKPILLSHATIDDLSGFLPEIAAAYRKGRAAGMSHVLVLAVHRMSAYAKA